MVGCWWGGGGVRWVGGGGSEVGGVGWIVRVGWVVVAWVDGVVF